MQENAGPSQNFVIMEIMNYIVSKLPLFCTLQKLHSLDSQSIMKYCYKLTSRARFPTNLVRQNIYLVQQISMNSLKSIIDLRRTEMSA